MSAARGTGSVLLGALLGAAVALGALGLWTYRAVEQSLRELRAASLLSVVEAQARLAEAGLDLPQDRNYGLSGELFTFEGAFAGGPGPQGVALEPYSGRSGRQVIGAWKLLRDGSRGVAVEVDAAEAYAPLGHLRAAFGVLSAALLVALSAALWSMRRRAGAGGRRVGAYRLLEQIGEGGVAHVYLARHDLLKRPAAVKILKPGRASDETSARFEREVQLASQLGHRNTVEIFDYGRTPDGQLFYAMEYLDGQTAAELVARRGALPVPRALHLLRQLCAGLDAAHARGLVHRDIKPENLMVCRHGGERDVVKILDFGLVKSLAEAHSRDLTRSLRILGTPLYMAPERLRNPADVDARADIYAVGAVAFFLLTGRRVFEASDDLALTSMILNDPPPRVSAAAAQPVPPELERLVAACLEKRREDRPPRAADLLAALESLTREHPWTQRDAAAAWSVSPAAETRA